MTEERLRELLAGFECAVRNHEGNCHSGFSWDEPMYKEELEQARDALVREVTNG